jgi:glycosyltransferase involved in cell wall biosynthesis
MPEAPPAPDEPRDELDLTILLPCYDEQEAIGPVIRELRDAMAGWPGTWEILVVDDGSRDASAARAEAAGGVRVVRRVQNGGSGAARKTGIREARGRLVAMIDADGTYPAKHLPELLSYFPEWDQVNGARTSEQGTLRWLRTPAKWTIRKLGEWIAGRAIPDLNTGMKVFKRDQMCRYLWAIPDGFSCVSSMTLAFLCNGHAVRWEPIEYRARIGRSKFHPVRDAAKYMTTVVRIVMYFRPLRVFLPLALGVAGLGVAKAWYSFGISDKHTLQESDIVILLAALMIGVVGLLADLIVAQRRELH